MSRADSRAARELFDEALTLEPENPEVLVQAAWSMGWNIWAERISPEEMGVWTRLARRAMQADPEDGRAHAVLGAAEMFQRNNAPAIRLFRRAIDLNPSLPQAHAFMGSALNLAGRPDEAQGSLRTSLRLSPNDPFAFHTLGELATSNCMSGKWEEAVDLAEQSLIRRPGYWLAHLVKVNALVRSGEAKASKDAAQQMREQCRGFSEADIDWLPYVDPDWNGYFKEGLRRASEGRETGTP
jgi:tetratricopeptide (TPR) repeat protein